MLAKLSQKEMDQISDAEQVYHTYVTLLKNQFLTEEQRVEIKSEIPLLLSRVNSIYADILSNHDVFYSKDLSYHVSHEMNEIYIELAG